MLSSLQRSFFDRKNLACLPHTKPGSGFNDDFFQARSPGLVFPPDLAKIASTETTSEVNLSPTLRGQGRGRLSLPSMLGLTPSLGSLATLHAMFISAVERARQARASLTRSLRPTYTSEWTIYSSCVSVHTFIHHAHAKCQ